MVIRGGRLPVVILALLIGLLTACSGPGPAVPSEQTGGSRTVVTDAGMVVVWQPERFPAPTELTEDADIEQHIVAGAFVPLYVHSDGVYAVAVRPLTGTEQRRVVVSSQPYLLVSHGSVVLTGLERVGDGDLADIISVPAGRYAATVHLIDRDQDSALPDFVVTLTPETAPGTQYRTSVETFDRPVS